MREREDERDISMAEKEIGGASGSASCSRGPKQSGWPQNGSSGAARGYAEAANERRKHCEARRTAAAEWRVSLKSGARRRINSSSGSRRRVRRAGGGAGVEKMTSAAPAKGGMRRRGAGAMADGGVAQQAPGERQRAVAWRNGGSGGGGGGRRGATMVVAQSGAGNGVGQRRGGALPSRSILNETTMVDKAS
ncbi:hypothetical protein Scep_017185 [Stephania cephalantha]|uniref:Uncharacterized protein n=1 Tax=Stephania cephalantha TaxID=152367 RepID=A0AAP0NTB9_9MAGN